VEFFFNEDVKIFITIMCPCNNTQKISLLKTTIPPSLEKGEMAEVG
jgi:hypothetical protein